MIKELTYSRLNGQSNQQLEFDTVEPPSGGSRGGTRPPPLPLYFSIKLRSEGSKNIFWRPPLPYLTVWMISSPLLSQGLDLALLPVTPRKYLQTTTTKDFKGVLLIEFCNTSHAHKFPAKKVRLPFLRAHIYLYITLS